MIHVIDEESFLAQNGASRQDIGDAALHCQPGSTEKSRARMSKLQNAKDYDLLIRRGELRKEYAARIAAGEIRSPTMIEQRILTANGHPDNESVQAARRLLTKRGIQW